MELIAQGRSNVAPAKLPWDLLRTLISETYGGKVDDEDDFKLLGKIVKDILDPAAYETDHRLAQSHQNDRALQVPSGTTMPDFLMWVAKLPEREPPTYLGLPANAEKLLLVEQGQKVIRNLARITDMLEEGEQILGEPEQML